jgi:hypothetical protein
MQRQHVPTSKAPWVIRKDNNTTRRKGRGHKNARWSLTGDNTAYGLTAKAMALQGQTARRWHRNNVEPRRDNATATSTVPALIMAQAGPHPACR